MRPTWRVAGALVLWLLLEWYGAASEVSWLFLLSSWIAAIVFVAAVYAWLNRGLDLRLGVDHVRPSPASPAHDLPERVLRGAPTHVVLFEGDVFDVSIGLDGAGRERGPAWVTGFLGNVTLAIGAGVVPRKGWRAYKTLKGLRRTVISATGWSIHAGDPLGFFHSTRACADSEVGVVYPAFASLGLHRETRELEATAPAPRAGAGTELFGVREYRPGDSLRRIHWRSSARHGVLVVREYEPPGVETLAVYLDPSPKTDKIADQVARIAASEAWDCLRSGGRVMLWGPGLRASQAAHARDLWALLDWLARYPAEPG
ncbi:MAG TPA: DUF58 domain-containing protein, partial [Candidatus Dormibacteraeota bacterium]|nr:DUF58 domain-containing protein [Candidatus Dormibacteraeota bacterium]